MYYRRTKALLAQKDALIDERRKTAAATRIQKESIAKVMDEIRSNANKAQKLITQALSGKVTLASLTSASNSPSPNRARPKSTGKLNTSKTTNTLLNLNKTTGPELNRSASANNMNESSDLNNIVKTKQYGFKDDDNTKVQAYVSPYTGSD